MEEVNVKPGHPIVPVSADTTAVASQEASPASSPELELFDVWLARKHSKLYERSQLSTVDANDVARIKELHGDYVARKMGPSNFEAWLDDRDLVAELLFPEVLAELNKYYLRQKNRHTGVLFEVIPRAELDECLMVNGRAHYFPPYYFEKFMERSVYVLTSDQFRKSQNPCVKGWLEKKGKFIYEGRNPENPCEDLARDLVGSINLVVETVKNGKIVFERVYIPEHHEITVNDETLSPGERNEAILAKVYMLANLRAYGIGWQRFKAVGEAYYQALLYQMFEVVQKMLPQGFSVEDGTALSTDLVFCMNEKEYLDLYNPNFKLRCTQINTETGQLTIPFSAPVFFRIPLGREGVFGDLFAVCNYPYLPVIFSNGKALPIKVPKIKQEAKKPYIGREQESQKKQELESNLTKVVDAPTAKEGKVPRSAAGKHKKKIIGGAAASSFALFVIAGLALIPGGQLPALLGALGLASDLLISALVAIGLGTVGTGITTGLTSLVYYLVRKLYFRQLQPVELKNFSEVFFVPGASDVEAPELSMGEMTEEDSFLDSFDAEAATEEVEITLDEEDFFIIDPPIESFGRHAGMYLRAQSQQDVLSAPDEVQVPSQSNSDSPRNK